MENETTNLETLIKPLKDISQYYKPPYPPDYPSFKPLKYKPLTSKIYQLTHSLTQEDVQTIIAWLNIPPGISEKITNGAKLLSALKKWEEHDPYRFYKCLSEFRPDLIDLALSYPWLATDHPLDSQEVEKSIKSFLLFLNSELGENDWTHISLIVPELEDSMSFTDKIRILVEEDYISNTIFGLHSLMPEINRNELVEKMNKYEPIFEQMTNKEFISKFKKELTKLETWTRTTGLDISFYHNSTQQSTGDISAANELATRLSHGDVTKIISALNPPISLFQDVEDGEDLLRSLHGWGERDPDVFLEVLASIRPDLVNTAKQIDWLILPQGLPQEILARGNKFVEEYKRACNEGSQQIKFFRLMIVGPEGVGKTSLLKALRSQPFEEKEHSTDFIEKTDITIIDLKKDWSQNVNFKDQLKETRENSVTHLAVQRFKSSSKTTNIMNTVSDEPESYIGVSIPGHSAQLGTVPLEQAPLEQVPSEQVSLESVRSKPMSNSVWKSGFSLKHIQEYWNKERTMLPIEFFTVWDLAGQSYLFCMHSLFLTPRAVYLIPVDLSVSLDDDVILRKREKERLDRREMKASKYLEIILYWIQTIYSVARFNAEEECKSRIMIVFTKSDIVDDALERANLYFKKIKQFLIQKTNCMSIVDPEFQIVSAKKRNVENFEKLKQSIHKNAELVQFDSALPIRWLDFALNILSKANPILGEIEVKEIANDTGCTEDYEQVLQLLHSIGVFFSRKNILVKSLPNLLNIILHIVSPRYCNDWLLQKTGKTRNEVLQDIEKAAVHAVLSSRVLNLILRNTNLFEVKSEIVELLEELGVILYGQGSPKEYYIPYLFTGDLSTIYAYKQNDLIFYLYFPDDQVPTSFYFAFISLCLGKFKSANSVPKLAFDCMKFQWKHGITWVNDFTQHQPYIRIILQGIDFIRSCPDIIDLISQIEMWTKHIQREVILSGKMAKIVLDCPCGSFPQTHSPCVYFETYQRHFANTHFYCRYKQKDFSWTFFDGKIDPFCNIPPDLGQRFLDQHQADIADSLDSTQFLNALFNIGLITENDIRNINFVKNYLKVDTLGKIMLKKEEAWANHFYAVLKSKNEEKLRALFESFILDSLQPEILVEEDLGFTRYPFHHNPCGICLIVNFENFEKKRKKRKGSNLDVLYLEETFESINFLIHSYEDLTRAEFMAKIEEIRLMDHSNFDAFFCIIMSHGSENDDIFTEDELTIKFEDIQERLTADKCPSLANKPKVFIIQACRGVLEDEGYKVEDDVTPPKLDRQDPVPKIEHETSPSSKEPTKKVPIHVDFYIARATVKGYKSYRIKYKGSLYINIFCTVLASERYYHHLGDIMVEVRRLVTLINIEGHVQCTEATDRLTKQLFLF